MAAHKILEHIISEQKFEHNLKNIKTTYNKKYFLNSKVTFLVKYKTKKMKY